MSVPSAQSDAFWARLRATTSARIGLRRTGVSVATADHLAFQMAHAKARDAVHEDLDIGRLVASLGTTDGAIRELHSQAGDRAEYLLRPDLGRRLDDASRALLQDAEPSPSDICFVVADGLSSRAVATNAAPLLHRVRPALEAIGWRIGPICVVRQARVAIGDEIGELCRAKLVAVLIGERPGLSAADSMGIYLTWAPRPARTDAERNCLSNIRPGGMSHEEAAARLLYLCKAARDLATTGIALKDETTFSGALPPSA